MAPHDYGLAGLLLIVMAGLPALIAWWLGHNDLIPPDAIPKDWAGPCEDCGEDCCCDCCTDAETVERLLKEADQ